MCTILHRLRPEGRATLCDPVEGVTIVSIVSLFPDTSKFGKEDFEREVTARFGVVPNFSALPRTPLSSYANCGYSRSRPIWTRLSYAFQGASSCLPLSFLRSALLHHASLRLLLGLGRSAGDPSAQPMTVSQVIRLLQRPIPTEERTTAALARGWWNSIAVPFDGGLSNDFPPCAWPQDYVAVYRSLLKRPSISEARRRCRYHARYRQKS
jgi:hypothetical protein